MPVYVTNTGLGKEVAIALGAKPGDVLVWTDLFALGRFAREPHGPEALAVRSQLWTRLDYEEDTFLWEAEVAALEALRDRDDVYVCAGRSVGDQSFLACVVVALARVGVAPEAVSWLRSPETMFAAVGPRQRADVEVVPVRGGVRRGLLDLWDVLTAASPAALARLRPVADASSEVVGVVQALRARFPHLRSGLGEVDRMLLRAVREAGPAYWRIVGDFLKASFPGYEDAGLDWVHYRVRDLARGATRGPLVEASWDGEGRCVSLRLTPAGDAALRDDGTVSGGALWLPHDSLLSVVATDEAQRWRWDGEELVEVAGSGA